MCFQNSVLLCKIGHVIFIPLASYDYTPRDKNIMFFGVGANLQHTVFFGRKCSDLWAKDCEYWDDKVRVIMEIIT